MENSGGLGIRILLLMVLCWQVESEICLKKLIHEEEGDSQLEGGSCCSGILRQGYGVGFWKAITKRLEVSKCAPRTSGFLLEEDVLFFFYQK